MKSNGIVFGLICLSLSSFAASKQDVAELLRMNRGALADSEADAKTLDKVAMLLMDTLEILEFGEFVSDKSLCLEYAVGIYKSSGYSSGDAMDRASVVCKKIGDLDVAKYVVHHFRAAGYAAAEAMDASGDLANMATRGKFKIVEFATSQYKASGYTSADAVQKGVAAAKLVPRNGLPCIQTAHQNYISSGYTSADAMDKAAVACQQF